MFPLVSPQPLSTLQPRVLSEDAHDILRHAQHLHHTVLHNRHGVQRPLGHRVPRPLDEDRQGRQAHPPGLRVLADHQGPQVCHEVRHGQRHLHPPAEGHPAVGRGPIRVSDHRPGQSPVSHLDSVLTSLYLQINNKVTQSLFLRVLEPPVINDNSTRR